MATVDKLPMLAEGYERMGNKQKAISWYEHASDHVANPALKEELNKRIRDLK